MLDANQKQKRGGPTADNEANKLDLRSEIQKQYGRQAQSWFSWVFDFLDLPANSIILDLGGGTGGLWVENLARIPKGWKIALLDIERDNLFFARGRINCASRKDRTGAVLSEGQTLPYADESFDGIIAAGVLDLLPDIHAALLDAQRTLRADGLFVATAGGKSHLHEFEDLLRPYLPPSRAEMIGGDEKRFGIENGAKLLAPYFQEIRYHDFQDRMVFHSLQPILDYVLSEQAVANFLTLENLGEFAGRVKRRLKKTGEISVTIRKGLFTARNRSGNIALKRKITK